MTFDRNISTALYLRIAYFNVTQSTFATLGIRRAKRHFAALETCILKAFLSHPKDGSNYCQGS